jgi:diguanylate cyclase (GGDEF)-like protein
MIAVLIEHSGDLVVSPGSARSIAFMNTLLLWEDTMPSRIGTPTDAQAFAASIDQVYSDFGEWQREAVELLISDLAESTRNLVGTVSSAVEEGGDTLESLSTLTSELNRAKQCEDISEIREMIRRQIDVAKGLIERQGKLQREMQQTHEKAIIELEDRLEKAETASHTDHLTHLANRAAFDYYASAMIQKAKYGESEVALAMLDLDFFKSINDTYGHAAGDSALNTFAGLLKRFLGPRAFISRFGGDEFVVAWKGSAVELKNNLNSLLKYLKSRKTKLDVDKSTITITMVFSAGVTQAASADTLTETMARADRALYDAKRKGRSQVAVDMDQAA